MEVNIGAEFVTDTHANIFDIAKKKSITNMVKFDIKKTWSLNYFLLPNYDKNKQQSSNWKEEIADRPPNKNSLNKS